MNDNVEVSFKSRLYGDVKFIMNRYKYNSTNLNWFREFAIIGPISAKLTGEPVTKSLILSFDLIKHL